MFSTIYPYLFLVFFSFCILIFTLFFLTLLATRHILQFTMFDSILLNPTRNITEIKNTSVHDERKSVALIITKTNTLI